jgi:voltage-gated potassium channel
VIDQALPELSRRARRRLIAAGLLRALAETVVLVAAYFLVPLDRLDGVPIGVALAVALAALLLVAVWQVRAIIESPHPPIRAMEALAIVAPLFLLLFAAGYFLTTQSDPTSFSDVLTRVDALYFTITVFSTVGFGDITATSQAARLLVSVQMLIDLLILGLGIKVLLGAVRLGREHQSDHDPDAPAATA